MRDDVRFVIVTGLSGAGKTLTTRILEDMGFFCVDNIPPQLIPKFAELLTQIGGRIQRIAVVCDVRGREFFGAVFEALGELEKIGFPYQILFLECRDEVLVTRYKESRRRHPLAPEARLLDGIHEEREALGPLRGRAHRIIDTSDLTAAQLREELAALYAADSEWTGLVVNIVTFGFKHGIPLDADLLFDVRFLPNPHYVPALRPLHGRDAPVAEYVLKWPLTQELIQRLSGFVKFLLPQYVQEGKGQLVVAIGCTGGRHRSVVVGDALAAELRRDGRRVVVEHRDIHIPPLAEPEEQP